MRIARSAAWVLATALLVFASSSPRRVPPEPARLRLLGPFVELLAEVQWIRFQRACLHGEEARALELAESALLLDPRATEGWRTLSAHLCFDLSSAERTPELARRREFFEAGLGVLRRGREQAARPGELELFRALVFVSKADGDPELWAGGARELLRAAAEALQSAVELGERAAAELLPYVTERLSGE